MTQPNDTDEGFTLPPETYDRLNRVVRVLLPAAGTLYFTLSELWGFPHGKEVVGTITAIALFFGLVVHKAASNFKKAEKDVDVLVPENPWPEVKPDKNNRIVLKVDPSIRE